jgi:acyl-CoA hydrolase
MAEEINLAGLLRPGDRLAWSAGPVEPAHLLGVLDRQLDRAPRVSALLNVSFQTTVDASRLASRATVTALGGAVTNRRFQEIGALDVLPINYSAMPDLVTSGRLPIDVVLLQLAADSGDFNLSLMVDHVADAVTRARVVVAEMNDLLPVTFGETRIEAVECRPRAPRISTAVRSGVTSIPRDRARDCGPCLPTDRGRCDAADKSWIIARCCVGELDDQARSGLALGHTGRSRR